jgi:D-alanyl-D-alanine carboxypeptidase (penicillin-binding protein 5/6)
MTARREKRRFHPDVETATRPRRAWLPWHVAIRRRRKPRFQVGPRDPAPYGLLPYEITVQRRYPRRRAVRTHSSHRSRLVQWGALVAIVCAVLAAVVSHLVISAPSRLHTSAAPEVASSGDQGMSREQALLRQPPAPFLSLQPHVATPGAQPPAIQAAAAFLFDPERGWILYQKNADVERSIASLTKLMTFELALDTSTLDQTVTIGPDAAALATNGNSYMGVSAGEQLTLRDLLYGLIVASGNDAAVAIADSLGGSQEAFVAMMNLRARQLGLSHTRYVSPDGLDDGNHSTARDLAVLSAVVMEHPGVEQFTSTYHFTIPETATHKSFDMWNTNDLLPGGAAPYPGATGIKTGFTDSALYCLAFSAERQGHQLIGVVLGDPSPAARAADAHALLDWGFAQE